MIEYRAFRNDDPPRVAEVWTASFAGSRTVPIPSRATTLLEYFLLSKPYFDPAGLLLAISDGKPIGFIQTGFVASSSGKQVDTSTGVICALGVVPDNRRQGVGRELLRRAEEYIRGRGANRIIAGSMTPDNPFLFGLYGGCDSAGVLASHAIARPFFEKHGYVQARQCAILQRSLSNLHIPIDPRFLDIRQQFDIVGSPIPPGNWWEESVYGPIEVFEYTLRDKKSEAGVARLLLWDMELFAHSWQQSCVGLLDIQVEEGLRRHGLGRYLLFQVLRHLQEQTFNLFETRVDLDNKAAMAFFTTHGFLQVESGATFERTLS